MLSSSCWAVDFPEDDFVDEVDTHGLSSPFCPEAPSTDAASTYILLLLASKYASMSTQILSSDVPSKHRQLTFCAFAFFLSPLLRAVLLLHVSVQHVLLREQDDSASNALQPQSQEDGAVALAGENPTPQTNSRLVCQSVWCGQATRWAGAHDIAI